MNTDYNKDLGFTTHLLCCCFYANNTATIFSLEIYELAECDFHHAAHSKRL
ncbi:MAG: hypothetical protein Q9M50_02595 [Methylococcales bacterium]|nr:hypothetical protein [Methylococcales bacterium]